MSRTLPFRCGAAPLSRVSRRGAARGTLPAGSGHLTGTAQTQATVRNIPAVATGWPDILWFNIANAHGARDRPGDRALRLVSEPRQPHERRGASAARPHRSAGTGLLRRRGDVCHSRVAMAVP